MRCLQRRFHSTARRRPEALQPAPRRLFAFDTFAGMPEPTGVDLCRGIPANSTPYGAGALAAPVTQNLDVVCRATGVTDVVEAIPGLFAETLPKHRAPIGPVALLHADSDWYESTWQVLDNFLDQVVPHGIVQLDDYGTWEGCRRAVHDFERLRGRQFALRIIDDTGVWFRKEGPTDAIGEHWRAVWHLAQAAERLGDLPAAARMVAGVLQIVPGLVQAREMQLRLVAVPRRRRTCFPRDVVWRSMTFLGRVTRTFYSLSTCAVGRASNRSAGPRRMRSPDSCN